MRQTKIIATIGPACDTPQMIEKLIKAGVNVFRFNLKHNSQEWHGERIIMVKQVAEKLHASIGTLLDLQGPEIRIGKFEENEIHVKPGEKIVFTTSRKLGEKTIVVDNLKLLNSLKSGEIILIDDGLLQFKVEQAHGHKVHTKVIKGGVVGSRKGVNLPNLSIDLPTLVQVDLQHLDMAARHQVDYIALSFARRASDVQLLRQEMAKRGVTAHVIAKIENQMALDNFNEILDASDGIMIARGDLGIEVEMYTLPILQKTLIKKTRQSGKPIITATQMLQSMVSHSSPTRAEISDVANAVLDRTDAVMLSQETAAGQYPLDAVNIMSQTAKYTEENREIFRKVSFSEADCPIAASAYQLYQSIKRSDTENVSAFIVLTQSGHTAKMLSTFRPDIPILAVTKQESVRDKLTLTYGIYPHYLKFSEGTTNSLKTVYKYLIQNRILKTGSKVVVIRSLNWGEPNQTNTISLETVTV